MRLRLLACMAMLCAIGIAWGLGQHAYAQTADEEAPYRVGPGITSPRPLSRVEPEYSPEARDANVQGTVVFQVVVNKSGRLEDIVTISPLGFGLEEKALEALAHWTFAPGTKEGRPVKILATIEVNFRLPGVRFDEKAEQRRTQFNASVSTLSKPDAAPKSRERAVATIIELSRKLPAAMYLLALWKESGQHVPKDPAAARELLQKAADKNYAPALYLLALRSLEAATSEGEQERAMKDLRAAATLGSGHAQFFLGNRYQHGQGVPQDPDRARRYFGLCAAQGEAQCQYRLAALLYQMPERRERDYIRAIALFELAAGQNHEEAKAHAVRETAKLTETQRTWKDSLKQQLAPRQ